MIKLQAILGLKRLKKLKKKVTSPIILVLLATFSCACKPPKIDNQIRRVWSVNFDTCYCQWYDFSKVTNLTKLEKCENFFIKNFPEHNPLPNAEYCDDLVGYSASAWAKTITPWGKELKRWGEDNCK